MPGDQLLEATRQKCSLNNDIEHDVIKSILCGWVIQYGELNASDRKYENKLLRSHRSEYRK